LWVPLAAALMLVITGVFIGRMIFTGDYLNERSAQTAAVLDPAVVAEFNELVGQYLDRAQMILMGLDNLEAGDEVFDLRHQQRVSQQLLRQGRVLKSHQAVVTDQQYGILVDEIERVLLQFANSEQNDFDWTVRLIQEGIEENSILLKITLTRLDRKGARPRQVPLKTSSIIA
ncbi:MAG: hypothetical protein KAU50_02165, partial [Candidatus Marinimicrobia bacterium]|nr:hypothetical protein [Candidatus Neomarinimicrobiota bacterium]